MLLVGTWIRVVSLFFVWFGGEIGMLVLIMVGGEEYMSLMAGEALGGG